MKRLFVIFMLVAAAALAQEKKTEPEVNLRDLKNKIFQVKNRDPHSLIDAVRLLGSGVGGTAMTVNSDLKTITVRDFPENIATIEEAIKRLDQPVASPDIEFRISVLIGSKSPLNAAPLPDDLAPVVKQLESTLRYAHYGLMTAAVQRTRAGDGVEGSGVAEPSLVGITKTEQPVIYHYKLRHISIGASGVDIQSFAFDMRVPIPVSSTQYQYQNVGFETPVSLKENEKVVIGTTTMGDKALIVVVTATTRP